MSMVPFLLFIFLSTFKKTTTKQTSTIPLDNFYTLEKEKITLKLFLGGTENKKNVTVVVLNIFP